MFSIMNHSEVSEDPKEPGLLCLTKLKVSKRISIGGRMI